MNPWDNDPVASPLDVALRQEGISGPLADLARSVYHQESGSGRNTATSNAGAVGGMQILPGTFREVADDGWDINDPVQNARAGVRYLGRMYEAGGNDPRMAAIGYYGGPGAIRAAQSGQARTDPRNPQAPNTFQYADQVVARMPRQPGLIESAVNAVIPAAQADTLTDQPWLQDAAVSQPWAQDSVLNVPAKTAEQPERGFWQSVGDNIMDAGRQVGLTARYGLEGLGQAAGVVTEPIRQVVNIGARAAGLPEAMSTAELASTAANTVGLPAPRNANERVVGDITRTMAGAGGLAGGARAASNAATGLTQRVLGMMGSNPTQQVLGAAGAGGAGGSVREAGGGPLAQTAAAIAGGLAVPMAAGTVSNATQGLANRVRSYSPTQVAGRVENALQQGGVDVSTLPPYVRAGLEQQARRALRRGNELNPSAMARLSDFQRVQGATPTRGMVSQDPQQITREMNLAKQQANSPLIGGSNLSQVQADNNRALVNALNQMGANGTDDALASGQRAIDALQRRLGGQQARVNDLYSLAKDSAGRSFPLDGRAFADRAIQTLDDNLVGGALPADVRNHLNRISAGEVPFTVDYAEQLKTLMARLQRNTNDGSARYALGLVRSALDDTPVMPLGNQTVAQGARQVNPGNLPVVAGDATIGQDALQAFGQARRANRVMMRQIENTPALKSLYDGNISPDNFINKYITSQSAKTADVTRLARMLRGDPQAFNSVKSTLVQQLKDKALSGVPDDIGSAKFSPAAYAKALKSIGDRKLSAFFTPDEIAQLHAVDRVGRLMVNQPVGSAVNNSNTAAAATAAVLDNMGRLGRGFKLFGVGDQISAIQAGLAQRGARNITPALTAPGLNPDINRLLPGSLAALLLAAPTSAQNNQ